MADKVEKILDIKVNYNEAVKAIAEYQTKIDASDKLYPSFSERSENELSPFILLYDI